MRKGVADDEMRALLGEAFSLDPATEDDLWADFTARASRETAAWMAFAACMAQAGRALATVAAFHA
jgi:hypothetical protein